jgi:hypothetical protein
MTEKARSIKKKNTKKGPSSKPIFIAGGCLGAGGAVLLIIGACLSGRYQILLLVCGMLLCFGGAILSVFAVVNSTGGISLARKRLVYRADCVEWVRGKKNVVGRLPFANVATVELASLEVSGRCYRVRSVTFIPGVNSNEFDRGGRVVTALLVTLYKPRDRDTWWPDRIEENTDTWDVIIFDNFDQPLNTIRCNIQHGIESYLSKKTGGGRTPSPGT